MNLANLFLNFCFFRGDSCQHNTGSLLVESFDHLNRMILPKIVQVNSGNSRSYNIVTVLVGNYGLEDTTLDINKKLPFTYFMSWRANYGKE